MTEELLDVVEVAKRLQLNPRTILRLVAKGELPALKIARRWRFKLEDLETYQRSHYFSLSEEAAQPPDPPTPLEAPIDKPGEEAAATFSSLAEAEAIHPPSTRPGSFRKTVPLPDTEGPEEAMPAFTDAPQKMRSYPPFDEILLPKPSHFVDRIEPLAWLKNQLHPGKIVSLAGMPGVGKTALVAVAVSDLQSSKHKRFPDGIAVIRCSERSSALDIFRLILSRFDPDRRLPEASTITDLAQEAHQALKGKKALVILEDLDPTYNIQPILAPLAATQVAVLLISRYVLSRNLVPVENSLVLELLKPEHALQLFAKSCGKTDIEDFSESDQKAAARIVAALGYHPLWIRLAGAYAADLQRPLPILAEEMQDPRQAVNLPDAQEEQGVVRAFYQSIQTLPPEAKKLFSILAAFPTNEFGRAAVLALGKTLKLPRTDVALNLLMRRLIVTPSVNEKLSPKSDRERVIIHPLLRELAVEAFERGPQNRRNEAQFALARYYSAYASIADDSALALDEANLIGLLKWSQNAQHPDLVLALCARLSPFWIKRWKTSTSLEYLPWGIEAAAHLAHTAKDAQARIHGLRLSLDRARVLRRLGWLDEAEKILEANWALSQELHERQSEGMLLSNWGQIVQRRGDLEQAERNYKQALAIFQEVNDRQNEGDCLNRLGQIARQRGQLETAEGFLHEALAIAQEMHNQQDEDAILSLLGRIARQRGDIRKARQQFKAALELAHESDHEWGQGITLSQLGQLAHEAGSLDEAKQYYDQSLELMQMVGDRQTEGTVVNDLGRLARQRGQLKQAEAQFKQALLIAQQVQNRRGEGISYKNLGRVLMRRGEWQEAQSYLEKALAIAQHIEQRRDEGEALSSLGELAHSQWQLEKAAGFYQQSLTIFQEVSDRQSEGVVLGHLGRLARHRGNLPRAETLFQHALIIAQEVQDRQREGWVHYNLGRLARLRGDQDKAADAYRLAQTLARQTEDRRGEGLALSSLAQVLHETGQLKEAEPLYQESLAIFLKIQDRQSETVVRNNLGRILRQQGRLKEAEAAFQEALALARETKNLREEAMILNNFARLDERRGRFAHAKTYLEQALAIVETAQDPRGKSLCLGYFGRISLHLGQLEEAERSFRQALDLSTQVGDQRGIGVQWSYLGRIALKQGKYAEAQQYLDTALGVVHQIKDRETEGAILNTLGRLAQHQQQFEEAERYYQQALAIAADVQDRRDAAELLCQLASLAEAQGDFSQAEDLYRQSLDVSKEVQSVEDRANALFGLGRVLSRNAEKREEGCTALKKAKNLYTNMELLQTEAVELLLEQFHCS
jgi:excisionase family DNA binding protein